MMGDEDYDFFTQAIQQQPNSQETGYEELDDPSMMTPELKDDVAMSFASSQKNVFDTLEEDVRSIRQPPVTAQPAVPVPQGMVMMVPVYVPVSAASVGPAYGRGPVPPADLDWMSALEAPKGQNYYKNGSAVSTGSGAKSVEELLKSGVSQPKAEARRDSALDLLTIDQWMSQFSAEVGQKPAQAAPRKESLKAKAKAEEAKVVEVAPVVVPQVVPAAPAAPAVVVAKVVPNIVPPPAPQVVQMPKAPTNIVLRKRPVVAEEETKLENPVVVEDENISKTQAMAKFFDKIHDNQDERLKNMPQALHNDEMFLMSGLRPVKPVHTYDDGN